VPVGRARLPPPPPPTTLDVAAYWAPSTKFAVLLALAHVIAASKTTTTAKDFTAGDFMCPHFCVYARCRWSAWEAVMRVTETTFQPKRIAGDKKVRSSANSPFDCTGATKPEQLVVCTENQILQ